jgi:DNA-binding NtrC family response regulator
MSRVLIMDDESIIRHSAGRVLSRMGHEVEYASHGEEVITTSRPLSRAAPRLILRSSSMLTMAFAPCL